jgi:hypothetical protein
MPAKSEKQKQFMDAAAHNPAFAKAAGVPVSVAKEFSSASKGMKFGKDTNTSRPDLQKVNKPKTLHGKMSLMKEGGTTMNAKMKMFEKSGKDVEKKGMKEGSKADMALDKKQMVGMKKGGMKKMAAGGMPMKDGKPAFIGDGKGAMKKGGMSSKMGTVKTGSTPNGVASKGKTKGKMIKMNMGGKAC